jgi:hypothetical protein
LVLFERGRHLHQSRPPVRSKLRRARRGTCSTEWGTSTPTSPRTTS